MLPPEVEISPFWLSTAAALLFPLALHSGLSLEPLPASTLPEVLHFLSLPLRRSPRLADPFLTHRAQCFSPKPRYARSPAFPPP